MACSLDAWDEEDPTATGPEVGCDEELWFEPAPELEPGRPVGTGKSVTLWVIVVVLWYKVVVRKVVSGVGSDVGWIDSIRGDMMRAACGVRSCSWCCCCCGCSCSCCSRWFVDVDVVVLVWLEERRCRLAGMPRRLSRKPPSIV